MTDRVHWTHEPPNRVTFEQATPKVFLVGPEPNGSNYPDNEPRDMGHYFQRGLSARGFGNVKFLRASLLQLDGVLRRPEKFPPDWWEDLEKAKPLLQHLLYLDLRPYEGGGKTNEPRVRQYVEQHLESIVSYWQRWKPSHMILQGGPAQRVFETLVRPELLRRGITVLRAGLPHPSANGYHEYAVATMRERFSPLDQPIQVWQMSSGWQTVSPKLIAEPKLKAQQPFKRRRPGYWREQATVAVLRKYLAGELSLEVAAKEVAFHDDGGPQDQEDVRWYARELAKGRLTVKG